MGEPGFSLSDLISAVDWTIKFIIELNQVQDQINSLKKDLETSHSQLNGLHAILKQCPSDINQRSESFQTLISDLKGILNDTYSVLKRLYPEPASNPGVLARFRRNVRFIVDNTYQGTIKNLQARLNKVEERIRTEVGLLQLQYHQNSYEFRNRQSIVASSQLSAGISSALEKETQTPASSITTENSTANPPTELLNSRPIVISTQPWPWVRVNAPPSPPPSPPLPPPPPRTSTVTTIAASPVILGLRRASTTPNAGQPAFVLEPLQTSGIIKVWFHVENPSREMPFVVKSIAILRDGANCFRGMKITRSDGRIFNDEISTHWNNVFKHPLPVHGRQTSILSDNDGRASNCIRFIRDKRGPKIPVYYSFSKVEDNRLFQAKIVGKQPLFMAEVTTISSAWSTTPLCDTQVLQLWGDNGTRSIQFFRNGKDQLYSQHSVSSLRVKSLNSRGLKLLFVDSEDTVAPGSILELERKMGYLLIVFTNPKDAKPFLEKAEMLKL